MRRVSAPTARVVSVGAGVSMLLIDLVAHGYRSLTALDVSAAALDKLREVLGDSASAVSYVCSDVRDVRFDEPVDVWHDRALFHFLTDPVDQKKYVRTVEDSVGRDGHLVIATFAPDGPERCSGLPVVRYSPTQLAERFGDSFDLIDSTRRDHITPWGAQQSFTHALLRKRPGSPRSLV